jgi:CheY-like chemotaxis protein
MSEGPNFRSRDRNERAGADSPSHSGSGAAERGASKNPPRMERRKRRRALISAPVRVRGLYASSHGPDEISTTVDVSRSGFLFVSSRPNFSHGMNVAVTFPYSNSPAAIQAEQPGRVVRVAKLPDGRFAVAVALPGARPVPQPVANDQESSDDDADASVEKPLVIVVDADTEVRDALKSFLTAHGYEVLAVANARQAHTLLNQLLPALLIAEIEGLDLPGYDLCARIKSTPRLQEVPVVLTTRSAYPSDYANAHSLGAVVCMAKPFPIERIGHVARLLVRKKRVQRSREMHPGGHKAGAK